MNSPLLSRPSLIALFVGSLAFGVLYWLSCVGVSALVNSGFFSAPPDEIPQRITFSLWWRVYGWAMYLVPGFLAGLLARRSGLMHGAIVGALTAPIMAALLYALGFWSGIEHESLSLLWGLVLGLIWCSFAGFVGELIASRVWSR